MRFKPVVWVPIAWILSAVNAGAIWFAARDGEPLHATIHAALALAFAVWAERLRRRQLRADDPSLDDLRQQMDELQGESRDQIAELQERLDFAERLLAQNRMTQGVKPPESESK